MNPRFKYTGKHQYRQLTATTDQSGTRIYQTPHGGCYSVTTILGLLPAPALDAWIERIGLVEAERIRDESAIIGTCMHNRLESYVKGEPYEEIDSPLEKIAERLFFAVKGMCLSGLSEVWGVEEALYLENLVAGRTDVIGVYNKKRSIIDYKTGLRSKSDDVLDKYKIQIALYAVMHDWMFENLPEYEPIEQGVILVGIRPNPKFSGGPKVQKVIVPKAELDIYRNKALDVIDQFHAGLLGMPAQTKDPGDR